MRQAFPEMQGFSDDGQFYEDEYKYPPYLVFRKK
jgi:hypothetical protein